MGWAARYKQQKRAKEGAALAADTVQQVRAALDGLGVKLDRRHELTRQVDEADWLAKEGFVRQFERNLPPDVGRRVLTAAFTAGRLLMLAPALAAFGRVEGRDKHLRWLKGDLDPFDKEGNEALDHLVEIEVAGLLARHDDLHVAMAEPDVTYERAGLKIGVACKRPKAESSFEWALRKATDQILGESFQGIALMDVSLLFLPAAGALAFHFQDEAEAFEAFNNRLGKIVTLEPERLDRMMEKGVIGALHTGAVVYADGASHAIKAQRMNRRSWHQTIEGAQARVEELMRLIG